MLCDNCKIREANVSYRENINGVKKELYLCEKCSKELGIGNINLNMPIDIQSFFGGLFEDFQTPEFMPLFNEIKQLKCDTCNKTFDEFINTSSLGCEDCYTAFEEKINPILKRIQGENRHVGRIGKVIANTERHINVENKEVNKEISELENLKQKLKEAVKEENYEEAAKIRDEIKKIEKNK